MSIITDDRYLLAKDFGNGTVAMIVIKDGYIMNVPAKWNEKHERYESAAINGNPGEAIMMYGSRTRAKLDKIGIKYAALSGKA